MKYEGWFLTNGGVFKRITKAQKKGGCKGNKIRQRLKKEVKARWIKSQPIIESRKASELSTGELKIAEFLKNNGVKFIREYHTTYLYSHKTKHLLFFDFYLVDQKAVIEFDGPHHFKPVYGPDKLKDQKYKDRVKNKYCAKRNIKILRIPYWNGDKIDEIICKWFDLNF